MKIALQKNSKWNLILMNLIVFLWFVHENWTSIRRFIRIESIECVNLIIICFSSFFTPSDDKVIN